MRMLNYATTSSNPFHRDNRSLSSTTCAHKRTQKVPILPFATESSKSSRSDLMGDYPNTRQGMRPPDAVFMGSKNYCSLDESDTFSEMTLSAAFSGSNLIECDVDSKQLTGTEINSDRLTSSKHNLVTRGKLSGVTLQETLDSRRQQSDVDVNGKRDQSDWNKWSKPSTQIKVGLPASAAASFGSVRKRLAQVKSKIVAEEAESKNTDKVPDFMVARARLKSTRRCGAHSSARNEVKPRNNLEPSFESRKKYPPKVVRNRNKRSDHTQIVPTENLGFECVPVNFSSFSIGSIKERSATIQECQKDLLCLSQQDPSIVCNTFSPSKEKLVSGSNEIVSCIVTANSIEENGGIKDKLNDMFARRSPAASSPVPNEIVSCIATANSIEENGGITDKLNNMFALRSPDMSSPVLNEIGSCIATSNSIEGTGGIKDELNVMFARRSPAASSPAPLLVSPMELSKELLIKNRKEVSSQIDMKAKLNSMLSKRINVGESRLYQSNLKKDYSSIVNTRDQGSARLASHLSHPPFNPDLNNLLDQDGFQCRDDVDQDERLDSRRETSALSQSTPDHGKYSKMLKMGLPQGAVKNAMLRDGVDPCIIFESEVKDNQRVRVEEKISMETFRRTRLHWEIIPVENFSKDCIWRIINVDSDIDSIRIDENEFNSLFQSKSSSIARAPRGADISTDRAVKVIDPKRANNGGIILARLRMSYNDIAQGIHEMNDSVLSSQQLIGIMDYVPTIEESKSLGKYLETDDFDSLCECEKFMTAMQKVTNAKKKMEAMLARQCFSTTVNEISENIRILSRACDNIIESVRLRKLFGAILKVGNRLNQSGVESIKTNHVGGFAIDSLAKLNQVKAWDKRTTILFYIVSIIQRWNSSLLDVKQDLTCVFKAQSVTGYEAALRTLEQQIKDVHNTVFSQSDTSETGPDKAMQENEMEIFALDATFRVSELQHASEFFKVKFKEVIRYLAQDESTEPARLFLSMSSFCNDLEAVRCQLKKTEKRLLWGSGSNSH